MQNILFKVCSFKILYNRNELFSMKLLCFHMLLFNELFEHDCPKNLYSWNCIFCKKLPTFYGILSRLTIDPAKSLQIFLGKHFHYTKCPRAHQNYSHSSMPYPLIDPFTLTTSKAMSVLKCKLCEKPAECHYVFRNLHIS